MPANAPPFSSTNQPAKRGRPKGIPNKINLLREKAIAATGMTPVEYLLGVMRDESNAQPLRIDAAKAVAPYCHPRLASVTHVGTGDDGKIIVEILRSAGDATDLA